jgi:hypothetical protein
MVCSHRLRGPPSTFAVLHRTDLFILKTHRHIDTQIVALGHYSLYMRWRRRSRLRCLSSGNGLLYLGVVTYATTTYGWVCRRAAVSCQAQSTARKRHNLRIPGSLHLQTAVYCDLIDIQIFNYSRCAHSFAEEYAGGISNNMSLLQVSTEGAANWIFCPLSILFSFMNW